MWQNHTTISALSEGHFMQTISWRAVLHCTHSPRTIAWSLICQLRFFIFGKEDFTMAIYHCSVQVISRSSGRSAVACAAYRAGDKITNEETGIVSDFSRKGGVKYSEIDLPENAPDKFLDRSTLWNDVQKVEKRKDAQLAREVEISLPKESDLESQIDMVRDFVDKSFVSEGMIADWSIHDKGDGNPHAHIMLTTRPLKEDGSWGQKERSQFALDDNGNRIPKIDPITGEQMMRIREGRAPEPIWIRENVHTTNWDDRDRVEAWREDWCEIENKWLVEHDIDPVTNESFARQGITDVEPTIHEGVVAREIEARGGHSDRIEINDVIKEHRSFVDVIKDVANDIKDLMIEKAESLLDRLESLIGKDDAFGFRTDDIETPRYGSEVSADTERYEGERQSDIEATDGEKRFGEADIDSRIEALEDGIDRREFELREFEIDREDRDDAAERFERERADRVERDESDSDEPSDTVEIDESEAEYADYDSYWEDWGPDL